jgi:c-di-GMP-binding flagellar brake protein YcgR
MRSVTAAALAEVVANAQRRENYRIRTDWWVRVNVPWKLTTQLVDISLSGARFMGELPCTPGVPIGFALEVPGAGDVPFSAEVVWIGRGETGVRFTDVPGKRAQLLREALLAEERRVLRDRVHTVPGAWKNSYVESDEDVGRVELDNPAPA